MPCLIDHGETILIKIKWPGDMRISGGSESIAA